MLIFPTDLICTADLGLPVGGAWWGKRPSVEPDQSTGFLPTFSLFPLLKELPSAHSLRALTRLIRGADL